MASIETSRPIAAGFSFAGLVSAVFHTVSDWNDTRVTRKALSQLTTRELEDIGLSRGDIDSMFG